MNKVEGSLDCSLCDYNNVIHVRMIAIVRPDFQQHALFHKTIADIAQLHSRGTNCQTAYDDRTKNLGWRRFRSWAKQAVRILTEDHTGWQLDMLSNRCKAACPNGLSSTNRSDCLSQHASFSLRPIKARRCEAKAAGDNTDHRPRTPQLVVGVCCCTSCRSLPRAKPRRGR